jgi:hypothetical protein
MSNNILISGLVWSGSGAVVDLLREYNNINVVPGEFEDIRQKNMIGDAIENSLTLKELKVSKLYIKEVKFLIKVVLIMVRSVIPDKIFPFNKVKSRAQSADILPARVKRVVENRRLHSALIKICKHKSRDERIKIAKLWFSSMSDSYSNGSDFVLFDQPIIHESHFNVWSEICKPFKLIVVYREPKDQMADILKTASSFLFNDLPWKVDVVYGLDKNYKRIIHLLSNTTLMRMKRVDEIERTLGKQQVLVISFEHLVEDYDKAKDTIEKFLGLKSESHTNKYNYFDPLYSKKNINHYSEYLNKYDIDELKGLSDWYNARKNS